MVQERNTNTFNSNVQKSKAYKHQNKEYNESSDESLFQVTGDWGYDCSDDDDSKSDISSSFKLDPGTWNMLYTKEAHCITNPNPNPMIG